MIRIGTRGSNLALIQAGKVKKGLHAHGINSELIIIKSEGDKNQSTALNNFNNPGVFTKELDNAILENRIDIAVHSCKDLPSKIDEALTIGAVLKRDDYRDAVVGRKNLNFLNDRQCEATIATGSVRRKAQWLHQFPKHQVLPIRGNVDTRLKKLYDSDWEGLIVAQAALDRLEIAPKNVKVLEDFVPAPCQGIIATTAKKSRKDTIDALKKINHDRTFKCMLVERDFLKQLQIGCSFPVGGIANLYQKEIRFECEILDPLGKDKIKVLKTAKLNDSLSLGKICAKELLNKGQHLLYDTQGFNNT